MRRRKVLSLFKKFLFGTADVRQWDRVKKMVDDRNASSIHFFAWVFTVVLFVVCASTLFFKSIRGGLPIYLITFAFSLLLLCATKISITKKKISAIALPLLYLVLVLSLLFGISISIRWTDPKPAVTFVVLVVISPLMICDKPWRLDIAVLIIVCIFLGIDWYVKPVDLFTYDFVNTISFYIISLLLNAYNQSRYVKEFSTALLIVHQRDTDSLSGVMTKRAFEMCVRRELLEPDAQGALMIVDIDNFKRINDTFGHAKGDVFIAKTGSVLKALFRQSDRIGRFGGDEFVIFLSDVCTQKLALQKADELRAALHKEFVQEMSYNDFSVSVGCTFFSAYDNYDTLFGQMDGALYEAKRSGKDCCKFFEKN